MGVYSCGLLSWCDLYTTIVIETQFHVTNSHRDNQQNAAFASRRHLLYVQAATVVPNLASVLSQLSSTLLPGPQP